ncbi:YcnI family copper-binding membrane protein [Goodfellowiella coeruleoviolacea]|uniref:Uncharacterized protein YcnI n=1 Tax=Goodfellowiella coeruleoviolacea TaxID=334858 RepID=A0AAE3GKQ9_9PSEU|nr:YcnI family protein [Goodfellowiella coeruleoviolacea]MCP2169044.1 Uncharacterized protein YcnI [Goodfellowiella coeruleoviolacea]
MSITHRPGRLLARAGGALAVAGLTVLATAAPALAHVSANPGEATKGGYTKITFRVPNERPDSGTVKIEVSLPADHPMTSVRPKPVPGWRAEVVKAPLDQPIESHGAQITEAVRTVSWTAEQGTRIEPDQFNEFDLSLGPLPDDVDQLVMPTKQTYDSGEVVNWDAQPPAAGAEEPEHPAPVVKLVAGESDNHGTQQTMSATATATNNQSASGGTDTTARWLGGAGLVVGALGLGFGAGAVLRARRRSA